MIGLFFWLVGVFMLFIIVGAGCGMIPLAAALSLLFLIVWSVVWLFTGPMLSARQSNGNDAGLAVGILYILVSLVGCVLVPILVAFFGHPYLFTGIVCVILALISMM